MLFIIPYFLNHNVNTMNLRTFTLTAFSISLFLSLSACSTSGENLKAVAKAQACSTGCDKVKSSCQDEAGMDMLKRSACDLAAKQCHEKC